MDPIRSSLFIPGNRESWVENAHTHGADVVVFDLEDSVPPGEKDDARGIVKEYISKLHAEGQRVYVRVNGHPNRVKASSNTTWRPSCVRNWRD